MFNRIPNTDQVDLVPLATLVEEGFGATPGELVDLLAERGFAIHSDGAGRLAVAVPAAATLREERAEQKRQAAQQAAAAAAEAAERQREAREAAAVEEAEQARQRESQARRRERIRALEAAAGMTIVQLEIGLRRSIIHEPGVGMSLDERARIEDRPFSLDEIEAWVLREFNVDSIEQVTS